MCRYFLLLCSIILCLSNLDGQTCPAIATNLGDVTNRIIKLGNIPIQAGAVDRERNIWDLQTYKNKVYIGFGNTITNAGPIALHSYNPTTEVFDFEIDIESEAIERFRVFNNILFVPNSDMSSGNSKKYIYTDGSTWTEVSDNHELAHVRDIYFYNNEYYMGGNSRCPKDKMPSCSGLLKQAGLGQPFDNNLLNSELIVAEPDSNSRWNWFFGFLEIDDKLIIPNAMFTMTYNPFLAYPDNLFFQVDLSGSLKWSYNMHPSIRLKHRHFFPVDDTVTSLDTLGATTILRPFESVEVNSDYLYTLRTYSLYDTNYVTRYNNSVGLVFKDNLLSDAMMVDFPDGQSIGEDLLKINGEVYALSNTELSPSNYIVYVYKSNMPNETSSSWQEVLKFSSNTMARSFEYHNGKMYFGMGNNHYDPTNDSGMLQCVSVCANGLPVGTPCDDNDPCTINDAEDGYGGCDGLFLDTDSDGVCDFYDNCPNQFTISSTLQFDDSYIARKKIIFNGIVNLSCDIIMNADTMLLDVGTVIDAQSTYLADIVGCP